MEQPPRKSVKEVHGQPESVWKGRHESRERVEKHDDQGEIGSPAFQLRFKFMYVSLPENVNFRENNDWFPKEPVR